MRIIKLSPEDIDFPDRNSVDVYFRQTLPNRNLAGQFLLTKGRIAENGIDQGELLIFSYKTEVVYLARANSNRIPNMGPQRTIYPFYFLVDLPTVTQGKGTLYEVEEALEEALHGVTNIVKTQGWPRFADSQALEEVWNQFIRE
ncbi:MAG TPA: hypothetical protein DCP92_17420 [Nitrospiraceae bacterium]|jgi:hypothetical protein|nr:hypothetical protein [Nitrospiraceae bacterium]